MLVCVAEWGGTIPSSVVMMLLLMQDREGQCLFVLQHGVADTPFGVNVAVAGAGQIGTMLVCVAELSGTIRPSGLLLIFLGGRWLDSSKWALHIYIYIIYIHIFLFLLRFLLLLLL